MFSGPRGTAVRYKLLPPAFAASPSSYAADKQIQGVEAIVQPYRSGHSRMQGIRRENTPIYVLNSTNPTHWFWKALPDSAAQGDELVEGSGHQVVTREGLAPSDPTIEQFDPSKHTFELCLVVSSQEV